jgi:glucokinase
MVETDNVLTPRASPPVDIDEVLGRNLVTNLARSGVGVVDFFDVLNDPNVVDVPAHEHATPLFGVDPRQMRGQSFTGVQAYSDTHFSSYGETALGLGTEPHSWYRFDAADFDPEPAMILAGDIGGTKANLALFHSHDSPRHPGFHERRATRDFPTLEALLDDFLASAQARPTRVTLGIAGPVQGNRSETTNLPWTVDGHAMSQRLGAPVTLLNDLAATGWGLSLLEDGDLHWIKSGERDQGARALIAAGTGLGEAIMVRAGEDWITVPSEGGHADFAPCNPIQDELLAWLRHRYGHVSYERVLSGPGVADLYRFLTETGRGHEPSAFAEAIRVADDPAVVVTEAALAGSCERATMALHVFADVHGAEAGNLALKALATGGVYIGGGIVPRIRALLADGRLARAFVDKGRLAPVLDAIPVALILDPRTALWGAGEYARTHP